MIEDYCPQSCFRYYPLVAAAVTVEMTGDKYASGTSETTNMITTTTKQQDGGWSSAMPAGTIHEDCSTAGWSSAIPACTIHEDCSTAGWSSAMPAGTIHEDCSRTASTAGWSSAMPAGTIHEDCSIASGSPAAPDHNTTNKQESTPLGIPLHNDTSTTQQDCTSEDPADTATHQDCTSEDIADTATHQDCTSEDIADTTTQQDCTSEDPADTATHQDCTSEDIADTATHQDCTSEDIADTTTQQDKTSVLKSAIISATNYTCCAATSLHSPKSSDQDDESDHASDLMDLSTDEGDRDSDLMDLLLVSSTAQEDSIMMSRKVTSSPSSSVVEHQDCTAVPTDYPSYHHPSLTAAAAASHDQDCTAAVPTDYPSYHPSLAAAAAAASSHDQDCTAAVPTDYLPYHPSLAAAASHDQDCTAADCTAAVPTDYLPYHPSLAAAASHDQDCTAAVPTDYLPYHPSLAAASSHDQDCTAAVPTDYLPYHPSLAAAATAAASANDHQELLVIPSHDSASAYPTLLLAVARAPLAAAAAEPCPLHSDYELQSSLSLRTVYEDASSAYGLLHYSRRSSMTMYEDASSFILPSDLSSLAVSSEAASEMSSPACSHANQHNIHTSVTPYIPSAYSTSFMPCSTAMEAAVISSLVDSSQLLDAAAQNVSTDTCCDISSGEYSNERHHHPHDQLPWTEEAPYCLEEGATTSLSDYHEHNTGGGHLAGVVGEEVEEKTLVDCSLTLLGDDSNNEEHEDESPYCGEYSSLPAAHVCEPQLLEVCGSGMDNKCETPSSMLPGNDGCDEDEILKMSPSPHEVLMQQVTMCSHEGMQQISMCPSDGGGSSPVSRDKRNAMLSWERPHRSSDGDVSSRGSIPSQRPANCADSYAVNTPTSSAALLPDHQQLDEKSHSQQCREADVTSPSLDGWLSMMFWQ
ncbi:hypothetical protein CEUSTIGMA_g9058.t1 [Chlamydomonas eustigma]|uniref:Uncharacterized protein n=1 Tax=Chlamydomonas eustigma TaxID=1157962 RepID=A0A250XFR4_9CHLO|nr:hypothetical protein CEUSTIGMA_g9058.t1 [Chlamydomonas eustigma]|eukprot:GAX81630.1 hypothetical protein CEUSTIGMA_g9058.t1 [Chlamydomonas eustigma]